MPPRRQPAEELSGSPSPTVEPTGGTGPVRGGRPHLVADRNIAYVAEAFGHLGEVELLPASELTAEAVREADLLLVRSTVRVNEALIGDSRVRFVATATIGTDHLDLPWLADRHITVASAPGSNAPSVALWWAAAMLTLSRRLGRPLAGLTVGVVGVGNVGRRVEAAARALGMEVLRCDPPRARAEGPAGFLPLEALLGGSDVVSLHVPLSDEWPDRTRGLLSAERLAAMRRGAWLVNACRGPVLDAAAAVRARQAGRLGALVLDVFDPEPEVPPAQVLAADLATPHIAGHSLDGKAEGTRMVYQAACAFLEEAPRWSPRLSLPPQPEHLVALPAADLDEEAAALALVRRFYDVERDHTALAAIAALPDGQRGRAFAAYRGDYPEHREPVGVIVETHPPRPRALALLRALGAGAAADS